MPLYNNLATLHGCLTQLTKYKVKLSPSELVPYQMKLKAIDDKRSDGKVWISTSSHWPSSIAQTAPLCQKDKRHYISCWTIVSVYWALFLLDKCKLSKSWWLATRGDAFIKNATVEAFLQSFVELGEKFFNMDISHIFAFSNNVSPIVVYLVVFDYLERAWSEVVIVTVHQQQMNKYPMTKWVKRHSWVRRSHQLSIIHWELEAFQ